MSLHLLAAEAVALVAKYIPDVAKGAAGAVGGAGAKGVLDWMKARLTGPAKEALDDLEKAPDVEDNRADLRKRLARALEAEPALADELRALLPAGGQTLTQTQTITGDHNAAAQITGSGNTVTFG